MIRRSGIAVVLTAGILALGTSVYLSVNAIRVRADPLFHSACNLDTTWFGLPFSCDRASESTFGELLGIPVSFWGTAFYAVLIVLAAIALARRELADKSAVLLVGAGVFSVLYSIGLFCVLIFVVRALCPFCMTLYALNILICAGALWAYGQRPETWLLALTSMIGRHVREPLLAGSVAGFSLLMAVGIGVNVLTPHGLTDAQWLERLANLEQAPVVPVQVSPGDATFGPVQAPYAVIEFSDFLCPFCAEAALDLERLRKEMGDRLHIVFKHLPLDEACNTYVPATLHKGACLAAFAAVCAQKAGRFWQMHDRLFTSVPNLAHGDVQAQLVGMAKDIGLDGTQFKECLEDDNTRTQVTDDIEEAVRVGRLSTPLFLLNGRAFYRKPYDLGNQAPKAIGALMRAGRMPRLSP